MSKKAIIMLVFACIFATVTAVLLVLDSMTSFGAYSLLFWSEPADAKEALGDAIGGILFFVYTILLSIGIAISCIITTPFLVVLIKLNGMKKWYNIAILAFTALALTLAIFYVAMLPIIVKAEEEIKAATSSSNGSSSAVALLF